MTILLVATSVAYAQQGDLRGGAKSYGRFDQPSISEQYELDIGHTVNAQNVLKSGGRLDRPCNQGQAIWRALCRMLFSRSPPQPSAIPGESGNGGKRWALSLPWSAWTSCQGDRVIHRCQGFASDEAGPRWSRV